MGQTARVWNAADRRAHRRTQGARELGRTPPRSARTARGSSPPHADKTARVWNAADGTLIAELKGHTDWVHSAAFSPDGDRVVTASEDRTARIWRFDAVPGDASTLPLWVEVLTGTEMKGGVVQPLSVDRLESTKRPTSTPNASKAPPARTGSRRPRRTIKQSARPAKSRSLPRCPRIDNAHALVIGIADYANIRKLPRSRTPRTWPRRSSIPRSAGMTRRTSRSSSMATPLGRRSARGSRRSRIVATPTRPSSSTSRGTAGRSRRGRTRASTCCPSRWSTRLTTTWPGRRSRGPSSPRRSTPSRPSG